MAEGVQVDPNVVIVKLREQIGEQAVKLALTEAALDKCQHERDVARERVAELGG